MMAPVFSNFFRFSTPKPILTTEHMGVASESNVYFRLQNSCIRAKYCVQLSIKKVRVVACSSRLYFYIQETFNNKLR
jgi:hypothetical protein